MASNQSYLSLKNIIFFLFFFPLGASAQNNEHAYDLIKQVVQNKSISLMERFYMTGEIEDLTDEQKIDILNSLLPEARVYEEKAVITRLYSLMAQSKIGLGKLEEAKFYLDSAFNYRNSFDNDVISGLLYFVNGQYHFNCSNTTAALESYYKAADYFHQKKQVLPILSDVYYNLSIIYGLRNDDQALKELRLSIHEIPSISPKQQIYKNSIASFYFYTLYKKEYGAHLLDSVISYNLKAIDVYKAIESSLHLAHQITENYFIQSMVYTHMGKLKEAKLCFLESKKLLDSNNIYHNLKMRWISGLLSYHEARYSTAEEELLEGISIMNKHNDNPEAEYNYLLIDYYDLLTKIYEALRHYNKALETAKKSLMYEKRMFNKQNNTIIHDLRVKYNLDQKEKTVRQLYILNEKTKRVTVLTSIIILLCLLVIVLLIIRFRQNKKMNKNQLQIATLKQQETELLVELNRTKFEEKEKQFLALVNETEQRRIKYYLEGLETERKRLAHNLHDNISNEIVAIKMKLENERIPREEALAMLQSLHNQVREISHELIPPIFQYASLQEILSDYVEQRNRLNGINIQVHFIPETGWDTLNQHVCLEIYRIIQEATGNVLKHADASNISISLTMEPAHIGIIISDDGKGFNLNKKTRGIGLHILKERIDSLNGDFNIKSEPGAGTQFEVSIPL